MRKFKEMKFRVENEEHSIAIQKVLFNLGYRWSDFRRDLINTRAEFLYTLEDATIRFGYGEDEYTKRNCQEYNLINGEIIKATEEEKEVEIIQLTYAEAWEKLKEGKEVFCYSHPCNLNPNIGIIHYADGQDTHIAPFHLTDKLFTMKKEPEYEILGLHDGWVEVEVFGLKTYQKIDRVSIYHLDDDGFIRIGNDSYLSGRIKFKGDHKKAKLKVTVDKDGNVAYENL